MLLDYYYNNEWLHNSFSGFTAMKFLNFLNLMNFLLSWF